MHFKSGDNTTIGNAVGIVEQYKSENGKSHQKNQIKFNKSKVLEPGKNKQQNKA